LQHSIKLLLYNGQQKENKGIDQQSYDDNPVFSDIEYYQNISGKNQYYT
jgi:hypothetical protein